MWLRDQGQRDRRAYRTKPKTWRTKRSQKCRHGWLPSHCLCAPANCVRACINSAMCVYSSMCSYAHTVCERSYVSVQLFYQAVTERQPLCVRGETAERRLLPSSSPRSDGDCLAITPQLFSQCGKIRMGPPQQSSLPRPGSLTLHGGDLYWLKPKETITF